VSSRRRKQSPPDIFTDGMNANPQLAYLAERPATERPYRTDPLDMSTPCVIGMDAVNFGYLLRVWHDQDNAHQFREGVHAAELERAAQPPVVHVTVTPPHGQQQIPGHFEIQTGPQRQVRYSPRPDEEAGGAAIGTTQAVQDRMRYDVGDPEAGSEVQRDPEP